MALVGRVYRIFLRRSSVYALSVMCGVVLFERAFDQGADALFEHLNEGVSAGPGPAWPGPCDLGGGAAGTGEGPAAEPLGAAGWARGSCPPVWQGAEGPAEDRCCEGKQRLGLCRGASPQLHPEGRGGRGLGAPRARVPPVLVSGVMHFGKRVLVPSRERSALPIELWWEVVQCPAQLRQVIFLTSCVVCEGSAHSCSKAPHLTPCPLELATPHSLSYLLSCKPLS